MSDKKKWLIINAEGTKIIFNGDAKQALDYGLRISKRFLCLPAEEAHTELPHYPNLQ